MPEKLITRIYRPTPANLQRLATRLVRGEAIAVPSETVYGLAANALDADACQRIFTAKGRPAHDPLIVHIADRKQLDAVVNAFPAEAVKLADAFWPGPLTMVLPKAPRIPETVTAGLESVAVRMPAHPLFRRLIELSGLPLAAPSANPFGYVSPTSAAHVKAGLGGRIRAILDGGPCPVGLESTIIDLRFPAAPKLLRPGGIPREALEVCLGRKVGSPGLKKGSDGASHPSSPGQLPQHYSPRTPLRLHERIPDTFLDGLPADEAVLCQKRPSSDEAQRDPRCFWLSENGRIAEIAQNLYRSLRRLDEGRWRCVHVERCAEKKGLGPAINDRLTRAATQKSSPKRRA